jgi:transcriptional regulator with PAS, ATPase and Fis domain
MSLLRRIVVASRIPYVQRAAQELAQEVFAADDPREAVDIVTTVNPDLILFDGTRTPAELRAHLQHLAVAVPSPCPAAVVWAAPTDPFGEDEYRQAGVADCVTGPAGLARLHELAARLAAGTGRSAGPGPDHPTYFLDETAAAVGLAGRSLALGEALRLIRLVAASQCNPVLVIGDTGTGKEVAARAVHHLRHADQPFVAVNCAALTANLLESELFGHVKGSFTGADRDKTGLLEMAGAGTIFLDEISEMPLDLQAKLLRILQEKTFRKVGGVRDIECQATIIASSNRDLKKEVREKRFRQDLYYRLNICPIVLAPLRSPQRRQDIPLLAGYFLHTSSICAHKQSQITSITPLALEALCQHDWPGNVRELRNVIERAILFETTDKIGLDSIVIDPIDTEETRPPSSGRSSHDFSLEKAERELIARALHETGWQKTQAAALLGITRATLYAKVKQYDIRRDGRAAGEMPVPAAPTDVAATATA